MKCLVFDFNFWCVWPSCNYKADFLVTQNYTIIWYFWQIIPKYKGLRECVIITWRSGGGRLGNGWNMPSKLSHAPPLIKQKLISTPPHIMIILRLLPPPSPTPHPLPWKKFPPIESLIPTLLVGFLPPVQKSLQMSRRAIWRVVRITGLWACVVFA